MIKRKPITVAEALPRKKDARTRTAQIASVGDGTVDVRTIGSMTVRRNVPGGGAAGDSAILQAIGNRRSVLSGAIEGGTSTVVLDSVAMATAVSFAQLQGTILDGQASQFLKVDGSRMLVGDLGVSPNVTIDGVDISAFKAEYDAFAATQGGAQSGLAETIQDTVGAMFVNQVGITLTYSDLLGQIAASVNYGPAMPQFVGGATYNGVLSTAARSDHTHGLAAGSPLANSVNLGPSAPGIALTVARSDHIHQLDQAITPIWTGAHNFSGAVIQGSRGIWNSGELWLNAGAPDGTAVIKTVPFGVSESALWIRAMTGQVAPLLRIESAAGRPLINLTNDGRLQSGDPMYVSGIQGWSIKPTGDAEFNNLTARGQFHASVFVQDEVHATGGTMLVLTAGTLLETVSTV